MTETQSENLDAIIVGAGMSGLYMLHKIRSQGLSVKLIEAGDGVGGVWFWNRYPGSRCDAPSIEYSYSFSEELHNEWDWSEVMVEQSELEDYLNFVADKFDLRKDIMMETTVDTAHFDDQSKLWTVTTEQGQSFVVKYCIMATGCLTVPNVPDLKGVDSFKGEIHHTARWPKEGVDYAGKKVAVIGCGSSGVQSIPVIAETASHLYAFQRSPVYTFPAHNAPLPKEYMEQARKDYPEMRQTQRTSQLGLIAYSPAKNLKKAQAAAAEAAGEPVPEKKARNRPSKKILDLTPEQRKEEIKEFGYEVLTRYQDVYYKPEANDVAGELYREALEDMLDDPQKADALAPKNYPLGCKRPVIDTDYYLAFNRKNVDIVDLRESGIAEVTEAGLKLEDGSEYDFDVMVYATGFDAMTGALNKIDIRGTNGASLKDKWEGGPKCYLGVQSNGFPNLFIVTGPGSPSVLSNVITSIEQHVEWISDTVEYMEAQSVKTLEPTLEAEEAWVEHVQEVAQGSMMTAPSCNSWYLGTNIPGKPRLFLPYLGGVGNFRAKCDEIVANGYEGFKQTAS